MFLHIIRIKIEFISLGYLQELYANHNSKQKNKPSKEKFGFVISKYNLSSYSYKLNYFNFHQILNFQMHTLHIQNVMNHVHSHIFKCMWFINHSNVFNNENISMCIHCAKLRP